MAPAKDELQSQSGSENIKKPLDNSLNTDSSNNEKNMSDPEGSEGFYREEYESEQESHHSSSSAQEKDTTKPPVGSPRHSYEYARSVEYTPSLRRTISRHDSALTAISRLRSRNPRANDPFTHPLMHTKTKKDVIVDFDGKDDPYRPINWPMRKKVITTLLYGLTTAGVTFASAVFSAGLKQVSGEFHISTEVSTLAISLMLLGFGFGPLIWGPLSELYGRKAAVLTPYFLSAIFSFATAVSKDVQTIMITRFFAGFFGSAPITNTGGVLGDIWAPEQRGMAVVGYAIAVVGGPTLGPLIGGALVVALPESGWRWTEYITGIYMILILILDVVLLDESFAPVLLTYKARRLRHETENWALHAEHEEWDVSLRDLAKKYLVRPFQMLQTPICFLIALYASFVYGILYANLSAFAIAFQDVRGWSPVVGGLPFVALLVGILLGSLLVMYNTKYYFKKFVANDRRVVPEARLPSMMVGGILFAAGMFVFGWTSFKDVPWIGSIIACAMIGFGFFTIFQASINYLVDTFQKYGASAIAANTFLRSCFAAGFPLIINPMYSNLGVNWGTTIFACIAALMIPIPFLFFVFGKRIRARGEWSRDSV